MNPLPRFSVVICNHNFARLVGAAIRSALEQDYPADLIEVFVVDDGSTDASRALYAQFAGDVRFTAMFQENLGQTATYLAGVQRAGGDYVCLLDSDDLYLPHKLRRARPTSIAWARTRCACCCAMTCSWTRPMQHRQRIASRRPGSIGSACRACPIA